MDDAKKVRLLLTATAVGAIAAVILTAFALLSLSIFWPVPLSKGLAVSSIAAMIGGSAFFVWGSTKLP